VFESAWIDRVAYEEGCVVHAITSSALGEMYDGLPSHNADWCAMQRQTVVSQFYKLDKLVVEGGKSVCAATILDDSGKDANTHSRASKQEREVASFDKKILSESFFSFHSSIFSL
jgi:hypothetical protein